MKTQFGKMAEKIILFGFVTILALSGGCKKEERNEVFFKEIKIKASPDTATITMNATYNADNKLLSYSITFPKDLIPTKIYFGKGTGVPIDPKDFIIGSYTSPVTGSTEELKTIEEDRLINSEWIVYINTKKSPDGQINARIAKK
ncbi:MAG: hypothetical protein V4714_15935 [Bacteroidota bacterium]